MSLRLVELHVLLALSAGPLHGYALAGRIAEDSDGRVRLLPGNLYAVIRRLEAEGLVGESRRKPAADEDQRRRCYQLATAEAEAWVVDGFGAAHARDRGTASREPGGEASRPLGARA